MPMYDKKAYKNPRLPRGGEVTAGTSLPQAPARAGGMLQAAAQARARQPKRGAPSIPETQTMAPKAMAAPPAAQAPKAGPVSVNVYGAPSTAPAAVDPKKQAAQNVYAKVAGQGQEMKGSEMPGAPGMSSLPGGDAGSAQFFGDDDAPGAQKPPAGFVAGGDGGDVLPPEDDMQEDPEQDPGSKYAGSVDPEDLPAGELITDVKPDNYADYYEDADPEDTAPAENTLITDIKPGQGDYAPGEYPEYVTEKPQFAYGYGHGDTDQAKIEHQKNVKMFSDYLSEKTGIPEEELQGQLAQVQMGSAEQMAKFAQQMAARGVGASGLVGQGMGQIASQAVATMANIRFENAKLAIDEKLNKMKAGMALHGQMMSEQNRMEIFNQMNELEQQKFQYEKDQNALADNWTKLNNLAAMAQAWDDDALQYAFKAMAEEGMSADEVMANLVVVEEDGIFRLELKDKSLVGQSPPPPYQDPVDANPLAQGQFQWATYSEEEKAGHIEDAKSDFYKTFENPDEVDQEDLIGWVYQWFASNADANMTEDQAAEIVEQLKAGQSGLIDPDDFFGFV